MPPKLLLADDSVTIQRAIELAFATEDVEVVVAGSGAEAMACVESERPDIVLADAGLPEPDGCAISAFIKSRPHPAGIPVVLLTSALEPLDAERIQRAASDGVLAKPFEAHAVVSTVRAILARGSEQGGGDPAGQGSARARNDDPLEAYFDRLDAAFASFAASPAGRPGSRDGEAAAAAAAGLHGAPAAGAAGDPLTNAFVAMFAPESAEPSPPAATAAQIPQALIDEIARRVIVRLGEDAMRRLVIETAERMVRDEIEKIKQASGSGTTHAGG